MVRGAIILGVGFSLGYAKAMHDSDEIVSKLNEAIGLIRDIGEREMRERHKQKSNGDGANADKTADVTAEAVDVTGDDTPDTPDTPPPTPTAA